MPRLAAHSSGTHGTPKSPPRSSYLLSSRRRRGSRGCTLTSTRGGLGTRCAQRCRPSARSLALVAVPASLRAYGSRAPVVGPRGLSASPPLEGPAAAGCSPAMGPATSGHRLRAPHCVAALCSPSRNSASAPRLPWAPTVLRTCVLLVRASLRPCPLRNSSSLRAGRFVTTHSVALRSQAARASFGTNGLAPLTGEGFALQATPRPGRALRPMLPTHRVVTSGCLRLPAR